MGEPSQRTAPTGSLRCLCSAHRGLLGEWAWAVAQHLPVLHSRAAIGAAKPAHIDRIDAGGDACANAFRRADATNESAADITAANTADARIATALRDAGLVALARAA